MARKAAAQRRNGNIDATTTEAIGTMTMTNADTQDTSREDIMMIKKEKETEIETEDETETENTIAAITVDTGRGHTALPDLGLEAHLHEDHDGLHHPIDAGVHIHLDLAIDPALDLDHHTVRGMTVDIQRGGRVHAHLRQDTITDRPLIEPPHSRSVRKKMLPPD